MKHPLLYIFPIVCALALDSCSLKEINAPVVQDGYIEFIARPSHFASYNVATKAKPLENTPTELENKIVSAFFMVFGEDGNRISYKQATVLENQITSETLHTNSGQGKLTVYYLVNVPESFVSGIEKLSDFSKQEKALSLTYADYSVAGAFGVPLLDGEQCFPMAGKATFAGPASDGKQVTITLKRLFSKVYLNLLMDLEGFTPSIMDGFDNLLAYFRINGYSLINLPKKILIETSGESPWIKETGSDYFEDVRTLTFDTPIRVFDTKLMNAGTEILNVIMNFYGIASINGEYGTVIYIPEYILKAEEGASNNDDQTKKADYCASDKRPVILSIDGAFHSPEMPTDMDFPIKYDIYLGADATSSFSLHRNNQYNYFLTIKGADEVLLDSDRVEIPVINLADPDGTGTDNPANCYIISQPGRYVIPTYKGNDVDGRTIGGEGYSSDDIAIDGSAANSIDNIQMVEKDGKHFIQFDVNLVNGEGNFQPADIGAGNKRILLKNGDNIAWSWHLWLCDDDTRPDLDISMDRYPNEQGNWNNEYVMNRHLGAISKISMNDLGITSTFLNYIADWLGIELADFLWSGGLYYQWGRKDPMIPMKTDIDDRAATYESAVRNPHMFYSKWSDVCNASETEAGWASDKNINDPCPPGYKVPSAGIWRSKNNDEAGFTYEILGIPTNVPTTTETAYTYNLTRNANEQTASGYIFYSYGGHYDEGGNKQEITPSEGTNYTPEDLIIAQTEVPKIGQVYNAVLGANTGPSTCRKFRKVQYTYETSVKHGLLWASDKSSLKYGFANVSLQGNTGNILGDFINDRLRTYYSDIHEATVVYERSGSLFSVKYTVKAVNWDKNSDGTDKWLENQSVPSSLTNGHGELREGLNAYLSTLEEFSAYVYNRGSNVGTSAACQVRCVKEKEK